jgi:hypothetical protein
MKNTQENTQNELVSFDALFTAKRSRSNREFSVVEQTRIVIEAIEQELDDIIIVDSLPVSNESQKEAEKLMRQAKNHINNTLSKLNKQHEIMIAIVNLQDLPSFLSQAQRDFLKSLYALRHRVDDYVQFYKEHVHEVKAKVK